MDENTQASAPKKSNTGLVIGAVILIFVVGGGAWFFMNQGQQAATTQAPEAAQPTQAMEAEPTDAVTDATTQGETKIFNVSGQNFSFSMKEIRVKKGDRVKIVFQNTGGTHDWVVGEFNARTPITQTGQTAEIEFVADQVGTFEFYCSVGQHRQMGMVGKLIVEE